jgi:hypothetical protein
VAIILRLVQQFHPSKKQEFLTLEKKFAALERQGTLPKGERMLPIAGREPANTIVWQGRFENLCAAEAALKLFESNPEHTELANQQLPYFKDAWVEFYEVLEA